MQERRIEELLESFDYVAWDRFVEGKERISIYGWIDRKDAYKDFIVLLINKNTGSCSYVTSSVKYHFEIEKSMCLPEKAPNCQRVEDKWKIKNSIKLK